MRNLTATLAGLVFGLGLLISDMANPARVLAFLDLGALANGFGALGDGAWDPTLMFVMGGAMSVSALAWLISYRREKAAFGGEMPAPAKTVIDARLIGGSALFGLGWGIGGICPGPAFTATTLGGGSILVFIASMLAGMAIFGLVNRTLTGTPARS